ncbi:HsdR family type I site-specific deoxyribonuclease [Neisseria sp.]|uniref:type I restriction endonuclease subunit R, EcoR124 family n=1 Tax=Neisseria sp. TaxID=192066 RepID=UPI0026DC6B52|nr:HsdR family type I site-specific deoxyribonuclease [Neisseria sp.]MDO4228047.1 HsdR family type I site-specific deoxyribonuclease [Neisseria sp.]
MFNNENEFEQAFIRVLQANGWEDEIIEYPSESDLLKNWADILFHNNRQTDRLNNEPLTDSEMAQLIEQINTLKTPLRLNSFINHGTVQIKRDNPADPLHLGKEISLKIYNRQEIAAGSSRYQIVRQPKFSVNNHILPNRRGDLLLLINGMPVFHIELKRSGVPISQAVHQIEKYHHNGVFANLFALVQIFVVANPDEMRYFANQPQANGRFNPSFQFEWLNFDNEPFQTWQERVQALLSIPSAHEMIGFYTIADEGDGCLKVMRSYQYHAVEKIWHCVQRIDWKHHNQRGGHIWHTTGSGKTMTSFKSAQLIALSDDADKVLFLMDRVELGTQSLIEYRNFADNEDDIQATENTGILLSKLKSDKPQDCLIVTSIQKMSNIQCDDGVNEQDIEKIREKRMVFIVDECHRTTFGSMMLDIKRTFPNALFFGFTGTPIQEENQRKGCTTSDVFGEELHRYSLADGIRDNNVLGFDVYRVATFMESKLREAIGLQEARADSVSEAMADDTKKKIYLKFQDSKQMPMAGDYDEQGKYQKGIEDYLPKSQYRTPMHRRAVLSDIKDHWENLSQGGLFHAIFATSSINEAIEYYRLFKQEWPDLKTTALFDPNETNEEGSIFKEDGLVEILSDYNERYGMDFRIPTWDKFKKDVANRLAHKEQYKFLNHTKEPEKCLDLLIVVDQMLTGFDSKFVNALYADKLMRYENIIQAFSRTNRLFGHEKPFGTIRYYRYPFTMERNIKAAVKLFSGDKPFGLFVNKLPENIKAMNAKFAEINTLFAACRLADFAQLPDNNAEKTKFAQLFREMNAVIEAATIQGMTWEKAEYDGEIRNFDEQIYLTLLQRYKELVNGNGGGGRGVHDEVPFDLDSHIIGISTGRIDSDYMNSQFVKYLKLLKNNAESNDIQAILTALHKSFAHLSQDEQRLAKQFLADVQSGIATVESGKTMRDYITEYASRAYHQHIDEFAERFGLDKLLLTKMLSLSLTENNLNEFGRFDTLRNSADKSKIKAYFEQQEGKSLPPPILKAKFNMALKVFLLGKK